jgi:uncharacterized membrane protein YhaH (DUF805 family)
MAMKPPLWRLFVGIIDRPAGTFEGVLARRGWWMWAAPLLILLVAFAVLTLVSMPYTLEMAREQAELRLAELSPSQAEAARATMEISLSYPVMLASSLGFGALALLIGLLAQATFLYFSALVAGGDDMSFSQVFTISAWTRLPLAVGLLVQAGYVAFSQNGIRYLGLSFLVATGNLLEDAANPLVPLLSKIDLFWMWHLALIVIGLGVVARFGRGNSLVLTLIYAALALGFAALPSLLFGGMV